MAYWQYVWIKLLFSFYTAPPFMAKMVCPIFLCEVVGKILLKMFFSAFIRYFVLLDKIIFVVVWRFSSQGFVPVGFMCVWYCLVKHELILFQVFLYLVAKNLEVVNEGRGFFFGGEEGLELLGLTQHDIIGVTTFNLVKVRNWDTLSLK